MRPDHHKYNNKKRNQGGYNHGEQQETVDDMTVAAAFAVQVVETTTTTTEKANTAGMEETSSIPHDDCELPVSSSDEEDESEEAANDIQTTKEKDDPDDEEEQQDDAISDDDDDESDVDLSEALAKMVNEEEDDDDLAGNRKNKKQQQKAKKNGPKTEHEIDPYQTPVSELQSKFNIDLEVNEKQAQRLASLQQQREERSMEQAGKIKFHMVDEKTVVVESLETITTRGGPLDEGTLLVLKIDFDDDLSGERPSADHDPTIDNNNQKKQGTILLPLGKIFEVFGPVSRPLYTVRLDSSPPVASPKTRPEDSHNNVEQSISSEEVQGKIGKLDEEVDSTDASVPVTNGVESKEEGKPHNKTDLEPEKKDPWGHDGQYTKLLKENPDGTVYYVLGEAKTINTAAIVQISGRGCDASNVYDEEIGRNEMEYSDDEQEREAKSSRRKNKNKKGNKNMGSNNSNSNNNKGPFINNNNNSYGRRPAGTSAAPMPNAAGYPQQQSYPPQQQHFPSYGSAGYQQPVHSPYAYQPQYSQQYHMPYPGHGPPHQQGGYATGQPHHPPPLTPPGSHFVPNNGIPPPPPPPPQQTYPQRDIPGAQNTTSGWHSSSAQPPPHPQEESDTVYYDYS